MKAFVRARNYEINLIVILQALTARQRVCVMAMTVTELWRVA